ncbi:uncharacterized protein LOC117338971 [Pecten maximus]|uniref:uncharacterized protein LOC117338971 n=1 Tax=Pecten maximus TaxID=6579 RepID=UPI001458C84F|nr:uncharacterized protein LOC117338971 [Pecten maximus]
MDTSQGSTGPIRRSRRRAAVNHSIISRPHTQSGRNVTDVTTAANVTAAAVVAAPNFPSTKDIAAELLSQMIAKGIAIQQPTLGSTNASSDQTMPHSSQQRQSGLVTDPIAVMAGQDNLPINAPAAAVGSAFSTTPAAAAGSALQTATGPQTGSSTYDNSIQSPINHVVNSLTGIASVPKSYSSISRPLDVHIDAKVKAKIMSHEFIEFGSLLSTSSHPDQFRIQLNGDNISLVPNTKTFQIKSIEQWVQAFHVFVSVYIQAHPSKTVNLMKYADTIQTLARRSGFAAAMFYDTNFRKWLQVNSVMPWDELNNELYMHALGIGLRSSQKGNAQQSFPGNKPNKFPKGKCWDFLKTGSCSRGAQCKFTHTCPKCGGQHSLQQCKKNDSQGAGAKPAPSQSSNKS